MEAELLNVKLSEIEVTDRAREDYGQSGEWESFKTSIATQGLIQPLAVKRQAGAQPFKLLAGGRRFRACQELNTVSVPVRIYPDTLTELDSKAIELVENIQRKQLSWPEEIRLKREVHELQVKIHGVKVQNQEGGWSYVNTGDLFGASAPTISRDLKLAEYVEKVPELSTYKNKADAYKVIERFEKDRVNEAIVERINAERATTPIAELHRKLTESYIVGDFFTGVKSVPDGSIDLIELDWPYGRDMDKLKKSYTADSKEPRDSYNEIDKAVYPEFVLNTLKECYRVMAPNAWIIIWFSPTQWYDMTWSAIHQVGLIGADLPALWTKPNGQTQQPRHNLASAVEFFFYARKGDPEIVKQGRTNDFRFRPVTPTSKIHPTERPVEMIQEVISTFARAGSRIMVPFLGSGNTLLAAANLMMPAFGWDLGEEHDPQRYKNGFTLRVHSAVPPNYKSYKEIES